MKFVIKRQDSTKKQKFEVTKDSKSFCSVRAVPSKLDKNRFDFKLSIESEEEDEGEAECIVEADPKLKGNYLISLKKLDDDKKPFGEWRYVPSRGVIKNTAYAISIGERYYTVKSSDLKDRNLSIVDTAEQTKPPNEKPWYLLPHTLLQTNDPFSKSNNTYHVTIHDRKQQLGYLAIIILLDLHECKRSCA